MSIQCDHVLMTVCQKCGSAWTFVSPPGEPEPVKTTITEIEHVHRIIQLSCGHRFQILSIGVIEPNVGDAWPCPMWCGPERKTFSEPVEAERYMMTLWHELPLNIKAGIMANHPQGLDPVIRALRAAAPLVSPPASANEQLEAVIASIEHFAAKDGWMILRELIAKWRKLADELRGLPNPQLVTATAAIGWLTRCADELEAALALVSPPASDPLTSMLPDDVLRDALDKVVVWEHGQNVLQAGKEELADMRAVLMAALGHEEQRTTNSHKELRVAVMTAVSVPRLGPPNPTWEELRAKLTAALNADLAAPLVSPLGERE